MYFSRRATHQGSKHIQLGFNNQDGVLLESFEVPAFKKTYTVGIVSDGCTGLPGFSKTEVGSNLLPIFCYGRCQEFVCAGLSLPDIPRALFQACTEFLRDIAQKVMPSNVQWGYPEELRPLFASQKSGRMGWDSTTRFRVDYLSATLLGFITDGLQISIFTAGDGIVIVNDEVNVIDQNNEPVYPAYSINSPGNGFETQILDIKDFKRLAICSDGPRHLVADPQFIDQMFSFMPGHMLGLQILLNNTYQEKDDIMDDDCTVVTLENIESRTKEGE